MSKDLTKQESTAIEVVDIKTLEEYLFTSDVAKKIDPKQKALFFQVAQACNLNPFKREVYLIPYWDKKENKYAISILTGYEVYLKRAESTGKLDGWHVSIQKEDKDTKAILTIHRKDWSQPFVHEVFLSEYRQDNSFWRTKPVTMLKKVAISQGFRMCFTELSGMPYTQDEMPDATGEAKEIHQEPQVKETPQKPTEKPSRLPPVVKTVEDAKNAVKNTSPKKAEPVQPTTIEEPIETKDEIQQLEAIYNFPNKMTELAEALGFKYEYEDNGEFFEYHVPLMKEAKKSLQSKHTFIVTRIFPNNDNHKGVPLVRGFIAALSGEPKMTFWTRQHAQCYRRNYSRLQRGCGNVAYKESDEMTEKFVNEEFIAFAKELSRKYIDAVLETSKFEYNDERYSTKTKKVLAKLLMDFFLPLPHEDDPLFKTMCQQRQSISGGSKGMRAGTSLYDGKITKDQAESFIANLQFACSLKEESINKIYAAGGWNRFALPNLTPQNEHVVRPILAAIAKQLKERFQ